ncbi:hypothetical protein BD413DRAFT_278503 [Trametes elegans]|nr:hypothetical protein BD413DRAFT_278503 [Trametes elegans]
MANGVLRLLVVRRHLKKRRAVLRPPKMALKTPSRSAGGSRSSMFASRIGSAPSMRQHAFLLGGLLPRVCRGWGGRRPLPTALHRAKPRYVLSHWRQSDAAASSWVSSCPPSSSPSGCASCVAFRCCRCSQDRCHVVDRRLQATASLGAFTHPARMLVRARGQVWGGFCAPPEWLPLPPCPAVHPAACLGDQSVCVCAGTSSECLRRQASNPLRTCEVGGEDFL